MSGREPRLGLPGDGDGRVAALSPSTNPASLGDPGWVNRSSVVLVGQSGVLRVEEGRVSVARQPTPAEVERRKCGDGP